MRRRIILFMWTLAVLFLAAQGTVSAQAVSTARGIIKDNEGNPLKGVKIVFRNTARMDTPYATSTNKKGRYYIDNLLFYQNQEGRWQVSVEYPGYVPTSIQVVSRTQLRVVDKFTKNLEPGQQVPPLNIRPLGEAIIDFILTPEDQLARVEKVEEEDAADSTPVPQEDPWDRALRMANEGDLEGSVEFFEKAVSKEPENVQRLDAFAKVLYQMEDYDQAESRAREALALDPSLVSTRMVLYSIEVARENYDAARRELEAAAEQDPGNAQVLEQMAWLASETGKPEDAIRAYESLTESDPESVESWIALGGLYAEQGMLEKSEQAYRKVVELDPTNAYRTFFNIGALIENKNVLTDADNKKAVAAFRKAVEIKPDYAEAWRRLAFASLRVGDMAGARRGLEKYLELAPDAADAGQVQGMLKALPK